MTNLYQMVLVVILVVFALVVLGVANLAVVVLCPNSNYNYNKFDLF